MPRQIFSPMTPIYDPDAKRGSVVVGNTPAVPVSVTPICTTYTYTGAVQTYTVPAGVTAITVTAMGAAGFVGAIGGYGGSVQATFPVIPGQTYNVYVGGAASGSGGGWPNGGNGGTANDSGGGGGAASYITLASADPGVGITFGALIVAAGGGGFGDWFTGARAGGFGGFLQGGDGVGTTGTGATQSAPGTGWGAGESGDVDGQGFGGDGNNSGAAAVAEGGGGGGGYHGGAASGNDSAGAGGGGSGWVDPSGYDIVTADGVNSGSGSVEICAITQTFSFTHINVADSQADPTDESPVYFTVVFSEAVTGFTDADVTLSGTAGATTAVVSTVDNITWTVAVTGMTGSGTIVATIAGGVCTSVAFGQPNPASTSTDNEIEYVVSAPIVVFADDFDRPNEALTASADWSTGTGWSIVSSVVRKLNSSDNIALATTELPAGSALGYVEVDLVEASDALGSGAGSYLRCGGYTSGSFTAIVGGWSPSSGGRWLLTGGSPVAATNPGAVTLRLEVEGTATRLYVDGALMITGSIPAAGLTSSGGECQCGFGAQTSGVDPTRFDNFEMGVA